MSRDAQTFEVPAMRLLKRVLATVGGATIALGGGCAARHGSHQTAPSAHAAVDVPDHFMVSTAHGPVEPKPDEGCRNPLLDPRDATLLILVRSAEGQGDYEAPPPRYGLRERELLRVECATGRALGIVPR